MLKPIHTESMKELVYSLGHMTDTDFSRNVIVCPSDNEQEYIYTVIIPEQ